MIYGGKPRNGLVCRYGACYSCAGAYGRALAYRYMSGNPRIRAYAQEDPFYWQVPALLEKMAETGASFADMNKEA